MINGNEGDDIISPGTSPNAFRGDGVSDIVRGGPGDDIINPGTYVFNDDGTFNNAASDRGARNNHNIVWDGGEGNDVIRGGYNSQGIATYLGGNGDDTFYPGWTP